MNQKRGAQSAAETVPGGAIASVLVWALSFTPYPMPPEVACAVVIIGGMASSYLIGRTK